MPLPIVPIGLAQEADDDVAHLDAALLAGGVQAAVLAAQGRYLQALPQPAALPAEGATGATAANATKPSDRATSLADHGVATRNASSRIQTSIDEYDGPGGAGWGYRQRVVAGGSTWERRLLKAGPGSWGSGEWARLP